MGNRMDYLPYAYALQFVMFYNVVPYFSPIDSWCLNDCYKTQLILLCKIAHQFLSFNI